MGSKIDFDTLKERCHELSPNLTLVNINDEENKILVHCSDCDCEYYLSRKYLLGLKNNPIYKANGKYCAFCLGKNNSIIKKGYNDLATTASWMMEYLKDKEDGYRYTKRSNKKIIFKCPECGEEYERTIDNVFRIGFSCSICNDNITTPNKFIRALMKQLPVENLDFEYTSYWTDIYIYDCYFEYKNKKYIVEMDGGMHYASAFGNNLEDIKRKDIIKDKLAKENGIILIRIECKNSDLDYIINNCKKSLLNNIFDFKMVDWDLVKHDTSKNIIKEVCLYKKHNNEADINKLCQVFHLSKATIIKYLKIGMESKLLTPINMCYVKNGKIRINYEAFKVKAFEYKTSKLIGVYDNVKECCREINKLYPGENIEEKDIVLIATSASDNYHGLSFEFLDFNIFDLYKNDVKFLSFCDYYNNSNNKNKKVIDMAKDLNIGSRMIKRYRTIGINNGLI